MTNPNKQEKIRKFLKDCFLVLLWSQSEADVAEGRRLGKKPCAVGFPRGNPQYWLVPDRLDLAAVLSVKVQSWMLSALGVGLAPVGGMEVAKARRGLLTAAACTRDNCCEAMHDGRCHEGEIFLFRAEADTRRVAWKGSAGAQTPQ